MMRYLILAAMLAAGGVPAPSATITKPKARAVTGGTCRLATNGTFGGNFGPSASLPTLALTIGPGAAMADQLHANKAPFAGPGKYSNEIIAVYLGKTALEDSYLGLGTIIIAADGKSGTFSLNDNSASGTFNCGTAPVRQ